MKKTQAPTCVRLNHKDLVQYAYTWLRSSFRGKGFKGHGRCSHIMLEIKALLNTGEIPDAIGWYAGTSFLVECKTSVSDFKADAKKPFRVLEDLGMGEYRYYLAPVGVLDKNTLPKKWGLLEVDGSGKIALVKPARKMIANKDSEVILLLSAIRRMALANDTALFV